MSMDTPLNDVPDFSLDDLLDFPPDLPPDEVDFPPDEPPPDLDCLADLPPDDLDCLADEVPDDFDCPPEPPPDLDYIPDEPPPDFDCPPDTPPDQIVTFLQALFEPGDLVSLRPIECWVEGTKKRSRVIYLLAQQYRADGLIKSGGLWRGLIFDATREKANVFFGVCPRYGYENHFERASQVRVVRAL
jgi:hypothetical protein